MTKTLRKSIAILTCICFIFSFAVTTNAVLVDEIIESLEQPAVSNMVEYNFETQTKTIIPYSSIPKYSEIATASYEVDAIASKMVETMDFVERSETASTFSIIDHNDPFILTPPTINSEPNHPYSGVVCISFKETDLTTGEVEWKAATGFAVSTNVVVTAAHVVLPQLDRTTLQPTSLIEDIKVYYYYNNTIAPRENTTGYCSTVTKMYYDEDYTQTIEGTEAGAIIDWAVLELNREMTGAYQFPYAYTTSAILNSPISITGYPKCLPLDCSHNTCDDYPNGLLVTSTGTASFVSGMLLYHTANTKGGNSGSPIYSPTDRTVYAIQTCALKLHTDGNYYNRGTIITEEIFNQICYAVISAP